MTVCSSCTTVDELLIRVARQMGDYSDSDPAGRFVTWSKEAILDVYNEAVLQLVTVRPDAFAETVEIPLVEGSIQKVPAGYRSLISVETNVSKSGAEAKQITPADEYFSKIMQGKSCLPQGCVQTQAGYEVASYAKSQFVTSEFTVSPAVPPGVTPKVKAVVARNPKKVCPSDTDQCIEYDAAYSAAVVEWMLYRTWGGDAEVVGGANMASVHFKAFYSMLGVQLTNEQNFLRGRFRPAIEQTMQGGRA